MGGGKMHEVFMREAIRLSIEMMREGKGGPFGAVIVSGGKIISRGWNEVTTQLDPTAHAEIVAIREACRVLRSFRLETCDIYASCEPCPMCVSAIYWARIRRLFFGAGREDAAQAGFDDGKIYREIALPLSERSLPAQQLLREQALEAFHEWRDRPNKIPY